MVLRLTPLHGGAFTRLSLTGPLPTALPPAVLRRIVGALAFWSGWPVVAVLPVDIATAGWCEVWSHALCDVPNDRLEVRFRRRPER